MPAAIDATEASQALADLDVMPVLLVPFAAVSARAWELRDNLTTDDASYVAAAELVGGRLLTLGARLAADPGLRCPVDVPPSG